VARRAPNHGVVAAIILIVVIGVVFAYWTARGGAPAHRRNQAHEQPLAVRARFIPIGTTRVVTLPGAKPAALQKRRLRAVVARYRARGWELVHEPLAPAWEPAEWTLTLRKVR